MIHALAQRDYDRQKIDEHSQPLAASSLAAFDHCTLMLVVSVSSTLKDGPQFETGAALRGKEVADGARAERQEAEQV